MCSTSKLINFSSFYLFQAEESLSETYKDKEYTGIAGLPEFTKVSADLAYGANNPIIKDKRVNYNEFLYLFIFNYICLYFLYI
jgi:aspartate/tyrosine/aromatic aminotransferase